MCWQACRIAIKGLDSKGRYDEYIESRLSNFKLVGAGTVVISGNRFAKQECLTVAS